MINRLTTRRDFVEQAFELVSGPARRLLAFLPRVLEVCEALIVQKVLRHKHHEDWYAGGTDIGLERCRLLCVPLFLRGIIALDLCQTVPGSAYTAVHTELIVTAIGESRSDFHRTSKVRFGLRRCRGSK